MPKIAVKETEKQSKENLQTAENQLNTAELDAIICDMKEKLGVSTEKETLIKWYDGEYTDPSFRAFKDDESERKEWEIRNAEWPHQFPWPDVIASMYKYPEKVYYSDAICNECKNNMLLIYFRSPENTWKSMCGRSGDMLICPKCFKQKRLGDWMMN